MGWDGSQESLGQNLLSFLFCNSHFFPILYRFEFFRAKVHNIHHFQISCRISWALFAKCCSDDETQDYSVFLLLKIREFFICPERGSITESYISGWNTSRVLNMSSMFAQAWAFNGDIGGWNTGQVESMACSIHVYLGFELQRWHLWVELCDPKTVLLGMYIARMTPDCFPHRK